MKKDLIRKDLKSEIAGPAKLISLEKAVAYYNNFYNTRVTYTKENTRAVWFGFEMLENYFEKVITTCTTLNIQITRFVFLLGAENDGRRTLMLAPATYDEHMDLHRAFSIDNGEISFLYRFAGENYSTLTELNRLQSSEQSLILSSSGHISTAKAIQLYNNYYDFVTEPFTDVVDSDTRFVWYEKGEFEGYLSYLKKTCSAIGGINVIFGSKNNEEAEGMYANRVTLFFAPAKSNNGTCLFSDDSEDVLDLTNKSWVLPSNKDFSQNRTFLFNFGQSGPPPDSWD